MRKDERIKHRPESNLQIDDLSLNLPAAFKGRAKNIARLLGQQLQDLSVNGSRHLDKLRLDDVRVSKASSDRQIAAGIVAALQRAIKGSESK